jgi:hypothetical protein
MPLGAVRSVYTVANSNSDMGSHGSVATFADPENNLFQLHIRPGGSV